MELRDYQEQCLKEILIAEDKGIKRQLVVMATGGGKTIVFSHLPLVRPDSLPMLVLAHREELLVQAKEKILLANPDLVVEIEQGQNIAGKSDVVVASVPTLGRSGSKRIEKYEPTYFKTIVVDEAHHAAATTYGRILDYFNPELVLGVTATPQRSDNVRLTDRFDEIVYYKTIEDLIRAGYLCDLYGYRVNSDTDISGVGVRNGDYIESELTDAIDSPERNNLVVKAYQEIAKDLKAVVFCASVKHAEDLAQTFFENGIKSACVTGTTPNDERKQILADLKSGDIKVITNVNVLTEGFDEPSIGCIIFAAPTRSILKYTQINGRGTRLYEGKDHCKVIDIADVCAGKKPIGLPTLLGLPNEFDLDGHSLIEGADLFNDILQKSPAEAAKVRNLKDIELAYERISLFTPPPPNPTVLQYSKLIWVELAEDSYYLGIDSNESLHIAADTLGRYCVTIKSQGQEKLLGIAEDVREAFARSDRWVQNNRTEAMTLLDSSAIWRYDPPSDKQIKWLKKFGVPITEELTRGEASQILDRLFKDNPQPKKPQWLQNKINAQKGYF